MELQQTGYAAKILSSLAKVFPETEPKTEPDCTVFTALKNETVSFQVAYAICGAMCGALRVSVDSPIADAVRVRSVHCVPCKYPAHLQTDDNYIRTAPGLYPDLLSEVDNGIVICSPGQWQSLWVDVEVSEEMAAGTYPITVRFADEQTREEVCSASTNVTVYDVKLKPQTLIRTEWFHGDCLANYYRVPVFSEEHWRIMENFIAAGVKRGMNMFLTPQFTPPLDTAKGGERTTIQLVGITVTNGAYAFDFTNLKRWVEMCKKVGVQYFEMSHLFSQWGATMAPKVMATVDGTYKQIFGWDTQAVGGEYTHFLHTYLPLLTKKLEEWGVADCTYFHISDEPQLSQLESYTAAKDSVAEYLKGYIIMDALSDYDFYKAGAVEKPVCANNHIDPFLEHKVENMWSYYCTGQFLEVSNRFMAMPSQRNRIYAVQLFKYDIEGTLQWGYNFYNSFHSLYNINPYLVTDSAGVFPSGDPFLVYPRADGVPEESIRMMVLDEAMSDLRAMQMLAELTSKEHVMELVEENLSEPITFKQYPKSDLYTLSLRSRINRELAGLVK